MNEKSSVDIVIAARNEARHLSACLTALAAQEFDQKRLTVFVVDDGSTDETAAIAQRHGATVVTQSATGTAAARNVGLRLGRADLVGFLDAHCIPNSSWVSAMANVFAAPDIGGCQGDIDNRAVDPRVARFLASTTELSNQQVLADSVRGEKNLYPWILSGNSMIRRSVIETLRGFDEQLRACEDVELSWRMVLRGYRLVHAPAAKVIHYEQRAWRAFILKSFVYGRGAAQLEQRYALHGALNKFSGKRFLRSRSLDDFFRVACYRAGYLAAHFQWWPNALARVPSEMDPALRPHFVWTTDESLALGRQMIFWYPDDERSILVQLEASKRLVLEGAGNFIWRHLAAQSSREVIIAALVQAYGIAARTAECDIDDLIEEFVEERVITRKVETRSRSARTA